MTITTGPRHGFIVDAANGEAFPTEMRKLLRGLDAKLMPTALDKDLTAPPGSPVDGACYLIMAGTTPTGAWAGHAGSFCRYSAAVPGWEFWTPANTWLIGVEDENEFYYWDGSQFVIFSGGGGGSVAGSDTQVQFNDGGVLGASADMTFNKTTKVFALPASASRLAVGQADDGSNAGQFTGNVLITDGSGRINAPSPTFTLNKNAVNTNNVVVEWRDNGSTKALFGLAGTTNGLITGSSANDFCFRTATQKMIFSANGGTTDHLTIATDGTTTVKGSAAFTGTMAIGLSAPLANRGLIIASNVTGGTTANGIESSGQIQSGVTSRASVFRAAPNTVAASFTLTNLRHYDATQGTFGAGSSVTNQIGFYADSTLSGGTNNYGFQGQLSAGTNNYNLYMSGSARNYLAGELLLGSAIENVGITTPSNPASGNFKFYFKSDGNIYKLDSSGVETQLNGAGGSDSRLATGGTYTNPTVTANSGNVAIGHAAAITSTSATGSNICIGASAAISGGSTHSCVAIGPSVSVSGTAGGVAIGIGAKCTGGGINITSGAAPTYGAASSRAIAIGQAANSRSQESIAIGYGAEIGTSSDYAVVIGTNAVSGGSDSVMIGRSSGGAGGANYLVSIGYGTSGGVGSVALGYEAKTSAHTDAIALGRAASTAFSGETTFGYSSTNYHTGRFNLGVQTSNNTATTLPILTYSGTIYPAMANNCCYAVQGNLVARDTTSGDCASYEIKFLIKRGANAASTSLVGTPTITTLFNDTGAASWSVAVAADTTNGRPNINVTGETGKTIRWSGEFKLQKSA